MIKSNQVAESGPKHADRKGTYHMRSVSVVVQKSISSILKGGATAIPVGAWTEKPKNGKAMSI